MYLHLQPVLTMIPFLTISQAFVKIDVSRLSSTSTVVQSDTTVATTLVTLQPNVTDKPIDTTATTVTTTSTNVTAVNTEVNQTKVNLDYHVPRTSRIKVSPEHYYCACDLMVNFCDINCCCDNDCTDSMLSVFVCNEKQWSNYDFQYDAGLTSCEIRNDLFCVVGKNVVQKKVEYDVTLLSERSKNKWPEMFSSNDYIEENRENYRSGDSVMSFDDKTEEIGKFGIPYSLTGDYCHTSVPIKYMEDSETKCLRSYDQNRAFIEEFLSKLKSTKILKSRKANLAMMMEHCTTTNNHCLEIQMFDCMLLVSRDSCVKFNSTEIDDTWINNKIVLQFRHNFTNILNCTAFLIYTNEEVAPSRFLYSVNVQFLQVNESMINIHRISGNIGYMQGKPIITAKMIPLNGTSDDDNNSPKVLDYFHPNKTFSNDEHFMKIPAIEKNSCVLTNLTSNNIRFGENLFLSCEVSPTDNLNITMDSNFTQICSELQQTIFFFMLNEYRQSNDTNDIILLTKISEFGNPKNDSKHWMTGILKHGIVDVVQSKYERDENSNEFICQNMILSMSYEFLYASLRVGSFEHQNLIEAVDLVFGNRVDLKFNFNEPIKVPIFMDIMFIDLTNSASFLICSDSVVGIIVFVCLLSAQ